MTLVIKFEAGLRPVIKHQEHDQSTHGSWANSSERSAKEIEIQQRITDVKIGDFERDKYDDDDKNLYQKVEAKYTTKDGKTYLLSQENIKTPDGNNIIEVLSYEPKTQASGEPSRKQIGSLGTEGRDSSIIDGVYVDEEHQRQGIATAMLNMARTYAPGNMKISHSYSLTDDAKGWSGVVKHQEHDQSSHGNWANGELSEEQKGVVSAWTSLSNKSSWRQIANDLSEGKKPNASEDDIKTVKTLIDAIKQNGVIPAEALGRAELLTTGLRWQGALPKVGDSLKNELSSATLDERTSERFSQYSDFGGSKGKPVIFHYGFQTKGLDVNRAGADTFADEQEWLVSGTFKITDRYSENGITHLNLKPVNSVQKHQEHDQSTHGSWATGASSAWSIEKKGNETTFRKEKHTDDRRGFVEVIVPNKFLSDPIRKADIDNALNTIEKLHDSYPINAEVKFIDGDLENPKFIGSTWSTNLQYGVVTNQTVSIHLSRRFFIENDEGQAHTLTHEWGHATDVRSSVGSRQHADKLVTAGVWNGEVPMTPYGFSNDREAYAEAFAIKFNNSHKGGIYSSEVQQTNKWEEVFKIFELDTVNKAVGKPISFKVWDTFDANNPPKLIEDYDPTMQKHQEHDQSTHGNWATGQKGGSGFTHRMMFELKRNRTDTMARQVYEAEEKHHSQIQDKNTPAPTAPNRADFEEYDDYNNAHKKYSRDFLAWSKKVTTSVISPIAQKHLDGTPRGVEGYVRDVLRQDWFIEAFGNGGEARPQIKVSSTGEAGSYQIGFKGGSPYSVLTINRGYSKNEPTMVHEIAHYATTISATTNHDGHGVEFARNHIFIAGKVMGQEFADGLEKAYKKAGIPLGD